MEGEQSTSGGGGGGGGGGGAKTKAAAEEDEEDEEDAPTAERASMRVIGPVPLALVEGTAMYVVWPPHHFRQLPVQPPHASRLAVERRA